jgi:hypothetical protein
MSGHFTASRNRALRLLAEKAEGCTRSFMVRHGFSPALIHEVIRAGLATVTAERDVCAGKPIEILRVKITKTGRAILPQERNRGKAPSSPG